MKYSFDCIDKNEKILSSATGNYKDINVSIENDILLQGACNVGSDPPPTIITITQKVTCSVNTLRVRVLTRLLESPRPLELRKSQVKSNPLYTERTSSQL